MELPVDVGAAGAGEFSTGSSVLPKVAVVLFILIALAAAAFFALGGGGGSGTPAPPTKPLSEVFTVRDLKLVLVPEIIYGDATNRGIAVVQGNLLNNADVPYSHLVVRARILDAAGKEVASATRPAGTRFKDDDLRALRADLRDLPDDMRLPRTEELLKSRYALDGLGGTNLHVGHFQAVDFAVVFFDAPSGCCGGFKPVADVVGADLDPAPAAGDGH
jgi:hypothetical protein